MRKQRDNEIKNLDDYVRKRLGCNIQEAIANDAAYDSSMYAIDRLDEAAELIRSTMQEGGEINFVTDYDVDGMTSTAIAILLMQALGYSNYTVSIPKRFTEGYGVSKKILDRLDGQLLITVDNGISAIDTVKEAWNKGMNILILDHHLPGNYLPDADVIIDPKAIPGSATFDSYCGAGLIYKLAEHMLGKGHPALAEMQMLAAVGTIADVMPLTGENRQIVREGLKTLNNREAGSGMDRLLWLLKKERIEADDVAFYLAPCLNAPGRLYDDGAKQSVAFLVDRQPKRACARAEALFAENKMRKISVEEVLDAATENPCSTINFCYIPNAPEGLIGIVAGKLSEKNNRPSFVMTDSAEGIKGSARAKDNVNNVFHMLSAAKGLLTNFGGHAKAAGFSLEKGNLDLLEAALEKEAVPAKLEECYDFEADEASLPELYKQLMGLRPFGEGFRSPELKIRVHFSEDEHYRQIGENGAHLRFKLPCGITAIAFRMAETYVVAGAPKDVTFYGTLQENCFNGNLSPQFMVTGFDS